MGIPFVQFGQSGPIMHFGHANGYPPEAYCSLLESLACQYQVLAMRMRPLWPGADPFQLSDWRPLADDLHAFLSQQHLETVIGLGHSMGATTALRLAILYPQQFSSLVLIDPVLFLPRMVYQMRLIYRLGLSYRLHPLASAALRRRRIFPTRLAMFENYRSKSVFHLLDDAALWCYVEALARVNPDGQFELDYSPEWEARIYVTGVLADMDLWKGLGRLVPPVLVIRGEWSDTFREAGARLLIKRLPTAQIKTIPESTHLVALEKPLQVRDCILEFLNRQSFHKKDTQ